MTEDFLKIELHLLLLRYGRERVVKALAVARDQVPEDLEAELKAIEARKNRPRPKAIPAAKLIARFCDRNPDSAPLLHALATRYENRTFLPHLKDIQLFLDRTGSRHRGFHSRREAARDVFTALSRMNVEDLRHLAGPLEVSRDSDFALLAREIMGRHTT